ncbi:hypothetical protein [Gottschalkia purinilytica]|nr:hypothetical protein [Gottschalkia purinilytica]
MWILFIRECSECLLELCESCYEEHYCSKLIAEDDVYEEGEKLPKYCPRCEEKGVFEELELDIEYDSTTLYCEKCDFKIDATQQLKTNEE